MAHYSRPCARPDIAIIPHFYEIPSFITAMIRSVARKTTVAGIDGSTALVGTEANGQYWDEGKVTFFLGKVQHAISQLIVCRYKRMLSAYNAESILAIQTRRFIILLLCDGEGSHLVQPTR